MRILWAMDFGPHDYEHGGDVFSTNILAKGLRSRGHMVTTISPTWPDNALPWYFNRVRTATRFARGLRSAFRDNPPSVVIAQNHIFPYVIREAKRYDLPVVVVCRDSQYRCPQPPRAVDGCDYRCAFCIGKMAMVPYPWFRHHINMRREWLPKADGWVVPSEYQRQDMLNWAPTTDPKVIYPPIDESHSSGYYRSGSILFMGRGRYKGADIVLELARHFEWKYDFKVCGNQDREHREGFERLINVELTGFTPRVDAFSGVTIQIAPVRWSEPFGRTIPEAGWLGIPSIVSDRGGLPEAVGPGGLIIDDPEDLESWSDAIELLMENRTVWSELSLLAMSHSQRFKANIQVMELEGMLDGIVNK